jgi:hypothetical protein
MSNKAELLKLFEDVGFNAENLTKAGVIFEHAVQARIADIEEDLEAKFEVEREQLVEALDEYLREELVESLEDVRKLMLLAVSQLGGAGAVDAFIKKIAALAREGALSAASSNWASGADDDSAANRASIAGGGASARKEEVEAEEARSVFEEVSEGLEEEQIEEFKDLVGDLTYSGDVPRLRSQLMTIRNQHFASPLTEQYVRAIARTVRKT